MSLFEQKFSLFINFFSLKWMPSVYPAKHNVSANHTGEPCGPHPGKIDAPAAGSSHLVSLVNTLHPSFIENGSSTCLAPTLDP